MGGPARVGVFGGSFDPPHVGHLLAASDAVEALGLDQLLWVPAAAQPLKHRDAAGRPPAPAEARLAMVRALVADDPRFAVDALEIERGGLSYTVDTLETVAARYPGAERFFLVGADVLASFHRWREPLRVRSLATLVVLVRAVDGGAPAPDALTALPGGAPRLVPTRRVDVSSTEVRGRAAAGRPLRGFVPDAVAAIIRGGSLYQ